MAHQRVDVFVLFSRSCCCALESFLERHQRLKQSGSSTKMEPRKVGTSEWHAVNFTPTEEKSLKHVFFYCLIWVIIQHYCAFSVKSLLFAMNLCCIKSPYLSYFLLQKKHLCKTVKNRLIDSILDSAFWSAGEEIGLKSLLCLLSSHPHLHPRSGEPGDGEEFPQRWWLWAGRQHHVSGWDQFVYMGTSQFP